MLQSLCAAVFHPHIHMSIYSIVTQPKCTPYKVLGTSYNPGPQVILNPLVLINKPLLCIVIHKSHQDQASLLIGEKCNSGQQLALEVAAYNESVPWQVQCHLPAKQGSL